MPTTELCFVIMSYGRKTTPSGRVVDFDAVYRDAIRPAILAAGLEPIRADEEVTNGVIHTAMFERLVLCRYAVADLTSAGANVFYELGVRHAARPHTTLLLFADTERPPFDVNLLRALPYTLSEEGRPADPATMTAILTRRLQEAIVLATTAPVDDSPLFTLLKGYPNVDEADAATFRDRVRVQQGIRNRIAAGIHAGGAAFATLRAIEAELDTNGAEAATLLDLYRGYGEIERWDAMEQLHDRMMPVLQATVIVREQRALCLNRLGRDVEAEQVLESLVTEHGATGERCGLLGRLYKDRWRKDLAEGRTALAARRLRAAIDHYVRGFECSELDLYPAINALTLMDIEGRTDPRFDELLPVVRYLARRRLSARPRDYFAQATCLELAALGDDRRAADDALGAITSLRPTPRQVATTALTLAMLADAREARGGDSAWLRQYRSDLLTLAGVASP